MTETGHQHPKYTDPVCGMSTDDPDAFTRYTHEGKDYYFCSKHCLEKFKKNPENYLGQKPGTPEVKEEAKPAPTGQYTCPMHPEVIQDGPGACPKCGMALEAMTPVPAANRTEYTCPMHPEIVQDRPGACPKCGMALEPRTVSREAEEKNPEYDYMRKRFIFAAILTVPLVIIAMREMLPGGAFHRGDGLAPDPGLAGVDPGDAGGALGRLGLLCPGGAIAAQQKPQHVHPDRPGRFGGLYLQPDCRALSRRSSRPPCGGRTVPSPFISRPRR